MHVEAVEQVPAASGAEKRRDGAAAAAAAAAAANKAAAGPAAFKFPPWDSSRSGPGTFQ